jgi:HAE1 family hydrophobic/amphiphilic exporter-1/multidrug efflux pump
MFSRFSSTADLRGCNLAVPRAGVLAAMRTLPIAQYPEIAPPVVTVQAIYPGASAEVIEATSRRRSRTRSTACRT